MRAERGDSGLAGSGHVDLISRFAADGWRLRARLGALCHRCAPLMRADLSQALIAARKTVTLFSSPDLVHMAVRQNLQKSKHLFARFERRTTPTLPTSVHAVRC